MKLHEPLQKKSREDFFSGALPPARSIEGRDKEEVEVKTSGVSDDLNII